MKVIPAVILAALLAACAPSAPEAVELDVPDPWTEFQVQCPDGYRVTAEQCWKICPEGKTAPAPGIERCDPYHAPIVDRRPVLGCPGGYVDHPSDPARCVLPIVAQRAAQPRPAPITVAAADEPALLTPAEREQQVRQDARILADELRREAERQRHIERRY